jgi:glycosyltransferase involved in cell wall biosynthesis
MTISVTHITFSSHGGAGRVAERLVEGQIKAGYRSSILKLADSGVQSLALSNPKLFWSAVFDQFIVRKSRKNPLFSLYRRSSLNRINRYRFNETSEIAHFHWISGVIPNENLSNWVGTQMCVWTIHDMWPFTGGCHHALGCYEYQDSCSNCPQVKSAFRRKVSLTVQEKVKQISHVKNLTIVAPSNWIAEKARSSSVLKNIDVRVIPNPVETEVFFPTNRKEAKAVFEIPAASFVVGCSAANLLDPQKNIAELIRQTKVMSEKYPTTNFVLLAIGAGNLDSAGVEIKQAGLVSSKERMAVAYNAMDVFVSFSIAENSPLTLIEASASGIPTICMDRGGMPEIVIHESTGFVLTNYDEFGACIDKLMNPSIHTMISQNSRNQALDRFSVESVLRQYEDVYHELKSNQL